jgi:virginiamycin A acetyltransferase
VSSTFSYLRRIISRRLNRHNLTAVYLRKDIKKRGFEVGEFSYGLPIIRDWGGPTRLVMGKYCSIADGVEIFLGGNHRVDWATTYPFPAMASLWKEARSIVGHPATRGDVVIGSDVWLGAKCVILSGITIGHGAVVGTRAVVTRDVPPYAIVAGNPARIVKMRFNKEDVQRMLAASWWELDRETVRCLMPLLASNQIEALLRKIAVLRKACNKGGTT